MVEEVGWEMESARTLVERRAAMPHVRVVNLMFADVCMCGNEVVSQSLEMYSCNAGRMLLFVSRSWTIQFALSLFALSR